MDTTLLPSAPHKRNLLYYFKRDWQLIAISLVPITFYVVFCYLPMIGIVLAFQDYSPKTLFFSKWVGLKWFRMFFGSPDALKLIRNTFLLSLYSILWSFPVPIIFAIMLHEIKAKWYQRLTQTFSYMPYFISLVVVVSMIQGLLNPVDGAFNIVRARFDLPAINFLGVAGYFRTIYISSGIWQGFGFGSIIYFAAIAGIGPELYDAAVIDGASKFQQVRHITIPGILPTIVLLLMLNLGGLLSVGFEKIILLYQPGTWAVSDVISSFVYRVGLMGHMYGFGAAVGLFNSVVNFILVILFNMLARRLSGISLW